MKAHLYMVNDEQIINLNYVRSIEMDQETNEITFFSDNNEEDYTKEFKDLKSTREAFYELVGASTPEKVDAFWEKQKRREEEDRLKAIEATKNLPPGKKAALKRL